jgi:hypothetical protein
MSAIRLAGDVNAKMTDNALLDDLIGKIQDELRKLGPLIDLEAIREPRQVRNTCSLPLLLSSCALPPATRFGKRNIGDFVVVTEVQFSPYEACQHC